MKKLDSKDGFTLIELLISIVIIAILAAIATVAYRGIQDRSLNAVYQANVNGWIKTLKLHQAQNGSYPDGAYEYSCLSHGQLAADGVFAEGVCMQGDGWQVSRDSSLTAQLSEVTKGGSSPEALPVLSYQNLNGRTEYYRGVLYLTRNGGHGITYPLKGSGSDCLQGATYFMGNDGFVACQIVLDGDPYQGL